MTFILPPSQRKRHSKSVRYTEFDAFWAKVDKSLGLGPKGTCWEWRGVLCSGYGVFDYDTKRVQATHWAWSQENGPVPKGRLLDHIECNHKLCVRPSHLTPATIRENTQRYFDERPFCKRGHPWIAENISNGIRGWTRRCKACHRLRARAMRLGQTLDQYLETHHG